jgi:hypothetical protein
MLRATPPLSMLFFLGLSLLGACPGILFGYALGGWRGGKIGGCVGGVLAIGVFLLVVFTIHSVGQPPGPPGNGQHVPYPGD